MLWRLFNEHKIEFITLFVFVLLIAVCRFFEISCIIYEITGIECPSCNMTRAVLALMRGDFKSYARLNIMALPVLTAFLGELFIKFAGRYKIFFHIYAVTILIVNFVYYINRVL